MAFFAGLLKGQPTLTLTELQNQVVQKNSKRNNQARSPVGGVPAHDLKVVSPFYKRIEQHPPNCKCVYHKRMLYKPRGVGRCQTQPNQIINQTQQISIKPQQVVIIEEVSIDMQDFNGWKKQLSPQQLEELQEQYGRTLKSAGKIKRLKQLDCYNAEFQKFLKNNYLVILDKKRRNDDLNCSKQSKRFKTEEVVDGKNGQYDLSCKEGLRQKKIGFKNNGRQLDDRKQNRKITKYYASRPSFFGLIDEQELIKEICMRFMHQNKNQNREGEQMVRQLVESDIDLYTKIIRDIQTNLEDGFVLPNLNEEQSKVLVKIVLQKIGKQVHLKKRKDSQYLQKNQMLQGLRVKFGWKEKQKQIGLHQFWKYTQSMKNFGQSRVSLGTEIDALSRQLKKNGLSYSNLQKKSKEKGKGKRDSRRSAFFNDKIAKKNSNIFISTSSFMNNIDDVNKDQIQEQIKPVEQFRFNNTKSVAKRGVLVTRKKNKKTHLSRQSGKCSPTEREKANGLVRKETCFFDQIEQKEHAQYLDMKTQQQKNLEQFKNEQNERNSSLYSNAKNQVLKHIQANKKFLKRIEHQLLDNQCHQFVIGIDAGIITKKRKIRALYQALEDEQIQQSVYYNDLIKYLQIYDEYCDLVVKLKKDKKIKSQISLTMLSQSHAITKKEEQQEINDLLGDIRKQRELKYFYLRGLEEKEDPAQELIIKIPQYTTTKMQRINIPVKLSHQKTDERLNFGIQLMSKVQRQESVLQKNLQHRVNMSCRVDLSKDGGNAKLKKKTIVKIEVPQKKKPLNKLDHYRKALQLYTCKTEYVH